MERPKFWQISGRRKEGQTPVKKVECTVNWNCSECGVSGVVEFGATGSARAFLQHVIWSHDDQSPACSGINVFLNVPFEIPSAKEVRAWRDHESTTRQRLRAEGLKARQVALAKKATEKKKPE